MEQSVAVLLSEKHFAILQTISDSWNKRPEEILKLVCEKALDTAAKNLGIS